MKMYLVMSAQSWDCIQTGEGVILQWKDDSIPDKWMPIFYSEERARELYPNAEIVTVTTYDKPSGN